jgi:hypothetical protein
MSVVIPGDVVALMEAVISWNVVAPIYAGGFLGMW